MNCKGLGEYFCRFVVRTSCEQQTQTTSPRERVLWAVGTPDSTEMMELLKDNNNIYKYVPFSINTLKLLIKGELWLGYPESLNDPFEGDFTIEKIKKIPEDSLLLDFYKKHFPEFTENSIQDRITKTKSDNNIFLKDFYNYVQSRLKKEYGVSCFSKEPNDIRMWSHYTDSHKGICLVFNQQELIKSIKNNYSNINLKMVDYVDKLPQAKLMIEENQIYFDTSKEIFLCKLKEWELENEIRLYYHFPKEHYRRSIPFDKKCLKGIIIGEKMEKENNDTLNHLIMNDKEYNIKWGLAEKDLTNNNITITEKKVGIIKSIYVEPKN